MCDKFSFQIGTPGHDLVPCIANALSEWSAAHGGKEVRVVEKGMNNFTEMYSAVEAEVPIPTDPRTCTNTEFVAQHKTATKVKFVTCCCEGGG